MHMPDQHGADDPGASSRPQAVYELDRQFAGGSFGEVWRAVRHRNAPSQGHAGGFLPVTVEALSKLSALLTKQS